MLGEGSGVVGNGGGRGAIGESGRSAMTSEGEEKEKE